MFFSVPRNFLRCTGSSAEIFGWNYTGGSNQGIDRAHPSSTHVADLSTDSDLSILAPAWTLSRTF